MSLADAFAQRPVAQLGGRCSIAKLIDILTPEDADALRAQLALSKDELGDAETERVLSDYLDQNYDGRMKPTRGVIGRHRLGICKCPA